MNQLNLFQRLFKLIKSIFLHGFFTLLPIILTTTIFIFFFRLIENPRKGIYSLGFLTGEPHPHLELDTDTKYFHVYIPSVPNPTTGHFLIIPQQEVRRTNLSRQDALTIIISGGIIQPE